MSILNLVFHNVVLDKKEIKNEYTIGLYDLEKILVKLSSNEFGIFAKKTTNSEIFFDDGYKGILEAKAILKALGIKTKIGVITDLIGTDNYLSKQDIVSLHQNGFIICSHSCSHPAFCLPGQKKVLRGGHYRNRPRGKTCSLSEQEIIYQLQESKKIIEELTAFEINEFIYPYGLYTWEVTKIIEKTNLYRKAYTCNPGIDKNQNPLAAPRILYRNNYTASQFINSIKTLVKCSVDSI